MSTSTSFSLVRSSKCVRKSIRQLDVAFLVPALDLEVESRSRGVVVFVRDLDVASRTCPGGLGRWAGGGLAALPPTICFTLAGRSSCAGDRRIAGRGSRSRLSTL